MNKVFSKRDEFVAGESEKEGEEGGGEGEDRGNLAVLLVDDVGDDLADMLHGERCFETKTIYTCKKEKVLENN